MSAVAGMAAGLGRELGRSQNKMNLALTQLMGSTALDQSAAALVGEIHRHALRQQTMVQQMMRLGRTDAARCELVDVNLAIGDMQARLTRAIGLGRVLELKLEPGLPLIAADPHELRETLIRLVANAKVAMPDGGTAEISTRAIEAEGRTSVELTVRDTGRSFLAAAKDRVFDPYFQFRLGTGRSGIALALVYQFAALCGGSIEVSGRTGEGTAYVLHLPAAENAPSDERLLTASA
jgi:signal transduction histidine kinase